jgi:ankyrin repeat protein
MMNGARVKLVAALGAALLLSGMVFPDSPVADAARRGDHEAVRSLLHEGADVNAPQGDGMTALHWAAERGDVEMTKVLMLAGASVRSVTRIGSYTPLHLASRAGSAPIVSLLIAAGSDVNARTSNSGVTALHLAAAAGDPAVVNVLLDHGADANAVEPSWNQTPLIFAAAFDRPGTIRVLIERGADPDATTTTVNLREQSALDAAARRRRTEILNAIGPGGRGSAAATPAQIQAAIRVSRQVYATETEDEEEQDRRSDDPNDEPPPAPGLVNAIGGLSALHHAAREGNVAAARALLDGGAKIDPTSGADGTTPLLMAAINGQFDVALLLVERGADPNVASEAGTTSLYAVLERRWANRTRFPQPSTVDQQKTSYTELLKALLDAGADPDARLAKHLYYMTYSGCGNRNCGLEEVTGATAFWRAAYATDVDAMRLLHAYGADPGVATKRPEASGRGGGRGGAGGRGGGRGGGLGGPDPSGLPPAEPGGPAVYPIHAAAGVGYGEGYAGNSHRHAPDGWLPSVRFLVEEVGIDVNLRDENGYTPLHHAAARGDDELILYLVSKGADVTVVSRRGQTAADMANGPVSRITPYLSTVRLLEALGSRNNHRCASC